MGVCNMQPPPPPEYPAARNGNLTTQGNYNQRGHVCTARI